MSTAVAAAPLQATNNEMTLRRWIAVYGAIIGAFMAILDIQITNASIREITGGLGATIEDGSWISTSYLVAEIIIIPLSGWLTRVLSLRTYLLLTSGLFLVFSFACGLAWNMPSMIVFRALQGITGGALIPLAFQVILALPADKRTLGMALFSITATFAPAIGPTVGGYLTEAFHWPVIFYINIIPGIILLATVLYGIDREPRRFELLRDVDGWGIITMAIGLSSLTVFLEEGERKDWFGSTLIVWLFVAAVVFITLFLTIELVKKNPFINLRLLRQRNFGLGCLANFLVGMSMYGALYLLPLYLSTIQGYNSIYIGRTMMWAGFPQLLILPFLPKILSKVDGRWVAFAGLNIFAFSCYMNSNMTDHFGIDQLRWSQFVRAIGQPMLMVPLSTITTGYIGREQAGSASGLFNMLRNLGGSVGIAILSTMFTIREQFHSLRIGERVTLWDQNTQIGLYNLEQLFGLGGADPITAQYKSYAAIGASIRKQATVMAFNDCFYFVAIALVLGSVMILLTEKVKAGAGGAEGAH